ncbi:MAG: ester cyclase [Nitrolancea sp.]
MSEQNKALIRRGVDQIWNKGHFAVADELVADDFVVHATTLTGEIAGREGITQYFGALRAAFPDLTFTIEDHIAEGNRVVTRWTARGTHRGEFQGMPATGKSVCVSGIDVDRIADGKIAECWMNLDELGLLHQLGAIPALQPS